MADFCSLRDSFLSSIGKLKASFHNFNHYIAMLKKKKKRKKRAGKSHDIDKISFLRRELWEKYLVDCFP